MKSHTRKLVDILWERVNKTEDKINTLELKYHSCANSNYVNGLYADFLGLKGKFEQFTCDHKVSTICPKCGKVLD